MNRDLTTGNITRSLLWFAFPIMLGNLLQQLYNVADTIIVSSSGDRRKRNLGGSADRMDICGHCGIYLL